MKFSDKIYTLLKKVPIGKVTTYKELAHATGCDAYRAVGQVLKKNPDAPNIPCHRVVATNGTIGGFNGFKTGPNIDRKKSMLEHEGIVFDSGSWRFSFQPVTRS